MNNVVRRDHRRWTETLAFADDFLRTHLSGPVSNIWKELCVSVTRTALHSALRDSWWPVISVRSRYGSID
eukprot:COSAG01_NODE_44020_length_423_cov_1.120370_1_plen_70_part_00